MSVTQQLWGRFHHESSELLTPAWQGKCWYSHGLVWETLGDLYPFKVASSCTQRWYNWGLGWVLRSVEGMRILSFPLGDDLTGIVQSWHTCAFAGQQCVPMQFNASHSFHSSLLLSQDLSALLFQLFLPHSSISVLYSLLLLDTLENVTLVNPVCEALKPETTPWLLSFIYYLSGRLLKAMIGVWHEDWVAHKTAQFRHVSAQESCDGGTAVSQVREKSSLWEVQRAGALLCLWCLRELLDVGGAHCFYTEGRNKQNTPLMTICYYLSQ